LAALVLAQAPVDRPTLTQFDSDVTRCRREMRTYCAITQDLMAAKELAPERQETAMKHLKEAQSQWAAIRAKYQSNPPMEYARDGRFKVRLTEIAEAMEDMAAHLEAGRARRSFQACGFGCGLFVSMHEENGLAYALDKLFHLRKTLKTAAAVNKSVGLDGVKSVLPDLMMQRNRALMAPCPCPDDAQRCQEYQAALKSLSARMDDLAVAVNRNDAETATRILDGLLDSCNNAYGLAL
jgi:hypothetical protein